MGSRRYIEGDLPDDGTVVDAFVKLLVAEPNEKDRDGLDGLVRRSLRLRGWLDAIDARIAVRAARLAEQGGSADAATVLAGGGRRARRDAEAAAQRGAVCASMPRVGEALAEGTVTAGHVDALARAVRHLDDDGKQRLVGHEDALISAAASMTPGAVRSGVPRSGPQREWRCGVVAPGAVASRAQRASVGRQAHRDVQDVAVVGPVG